MPRETVERFASRGLRTGSPADALQPGELPIAVNVRGDTPTELTCRAGFALKFATQNDTVRNIASYTEAGTLGQPPRILASVAGDIYLDDGTVVDTGYAGATPPSMVPFRPAQSPAPWMYISDASQYRKLSAPSPVIAQNAGIIEPQASPEVGMPAPAGNNLDEHAGFTSTGTAGGVTNTTRTTDTVVAIFPDPNGFNETWQVGATVSYNKEQEIHFTNSLGAASGGVIPDVFTPLPSGIAIAGIEYYAGTTGRCVVVPVFQQPGPGNEQSIFEQAAIANLRRGALVQIGTEVCYVLDVETGPLGTVCFTTTTALAHTAAETMSGVPAIMFYQGNSSYAGMAIASFQWQVTIGSGIGAIQDVFFPAGSLFVATNGVPFQPDDYVTFGVWCEDLSKLNEMKLVFDVNNGTPDFVTNTYYYAVRPSDIQAGVDNQLTQLGVAQLVSQRNQIDEESLAGHNTPSSLQTLPGSGSWSQIRFPIRELIRTGTTESQTLLNMQGVQFLFNTNASVQMAVSGLFIFGQFQMDVGQYGVPYTYRCRGRSSITGAKSNPSPATRYGWSPRRQELFVTLPAPADAQIDLWDVFRMGGALDTYRLVGTIPVAAGGFTDNYSDIAIAEAEVLEFDNLQPWPSLDVPLEVGTGVAVNGTIVKFSLAGGAAQLATIPRYLPGNLVRINETVYTLYTRPTVAGTLVTFALVENADVVPSGALYIYEPSVAQQNLPYVWGPTAEGGVMFGVGDPNRPGTVSFSKNFNPDSVPDSYNLEVSPPSEPLVGGLLHAGQALVFSNVHWWALRPAFGGVNQWTASLLPIPAGCVSHFAACSHGQDVYFVGKDGVYSFNRGLLTPRDKIYSLFPHEGVPGADWLWAGVTINAPNYELAPQFRLSCANGFLYFDYI